MVLLFAWLALSNSPQTMHNWIVTLIASFAGGVSGVLAGLIFALVWQLLFLSEGNGVLGQHEYELQDEGLFERTAINEGLSRWEGVRDVRVAGPYLVVRISDILFHVIPARSFASREKFGEFANGAISCWKKNRR
jgi:hypothetical protein